MWKTETKQTMNRLDTNIHMIIGICIYIQMTNLEFWKDGGSKKQEQKTRFEAAFFVLVKTIFLYIDDYRYCF